MSKHITPARPHDAGPPARDASADPVQPSDHPDAIPAGTVFRIFRTAAGLSRTTVAREALVVSAGRLARIERGSQASPVELHMIGSAIGRLAAGMVGSR